LFIVKLLSVYAVPIFVSGDMCDCRIRRK